MNFPIWQSLEFLVVKERAMFGQTLPISLNISKCDPTLLTASNNLKEFINSYTNHKDIFDLQERHDNMELNTNKTFFSHDYIMDILMFISAIVSLPATILIVYLLCTHKKLWTLIASLFLHQVKEVDAEVTQKEINSECKTLAYIGITLTILSLAMVTFLHYRKSKICRGHTFHNTVNLVVFMSDVQNYIPIKICKTTGSIHLFRITGMLKAENIKLNKNYTWDTLEIDWKEVTVTFNKNKINLPRVVTITLQDKIKVRCLMNRQLLFFHIMLKQGITWYTLAAGTQHTV